MVVGLLACCVPSFCGDSYQQPLKDIPLAAGAENREIQTTDANFKTLRLVESLSSSWAGYGILSKLGHDVDSFWGASRNTRNGWAEVLEQKIYRGSIKFEPSWDSPEIGRRLRRFVDSELTSAGWKEIPLALHQYLVARTACAWVRSNVTYSIVPVGAQTEQNGVAYCLAQNPPTGQCSTKAYLLRAIIDEAAKDLNLECWYVGGWLKSPQGPREYYESNHAWNVFVFEGGLQLPADVTGYLSPQDRTANTKEIGTLCILPLYPYRLNMFAATHFGIMKARGQGQASDSIPTDQKFDSVFRNRLSEWFRTDTSTYQALENRFPK